MDFVANNWTGILPTWPCFLFTTGIGVGIFLNKPFEKNHLMIVIIHHRCGAHARYLLNFIFHCNFVPSSVVVKHYKHIGHADNKYLFKSLYFLYLYIFIFLYIYISSVVVKHHKHIEHAENEISLQIFIFQFWLFLSSCPVAV